MQLIYGSYAHAKNEVALRTQSEIVRSDRGYALRLRETWECRGTLVGDDVDDLNGKAESLKSAYLVEYQDAVFLTDDGSYTLLKMVNADSFDGVKIIKPINFPNLDGAQFAVVLDYEFALQAEFELPDSTNGAGDPTVTEYNEQLTIVGGAPVRRKLLRPSGRPIIVTVIEDPGFDASQSGSMTSTSPNAQIPLPLWPEALAGPPQIVYAAPVMRSGAPISYRYQWQYDYVSDSQLSGKLTPPQ